MQDEGRNSRKQRPFRISTNVKLVSPNVWSIRASFEWPKGSGCTGRFRMLKELTPKQTVHAYVG